MHYVYAIGSGFVAGVVVSAIYFVPAKNAVEKELSALKQRFHL